MAEATVIAKDTGSEMQVQSEAIALTEASVVVLDLDRADIASFERRGQDLVLVLASGETILVQGFFANWPDGEMSQLVLNEDDGSLWWLRTENGVDIAQYSPIDSVDQLLSAAGSEQGSGIGIVPGLIAAGGILGGLIATSSGGSSGDNSPPPSPPPPPRG